ncbi:hypothetical protein [Kribbella sp. VKM Ac-2568]|uniref:hypothetical protein n=1 Tax=Kribbella sp. VKM Ac-2568 TaxID=2512219 RepID=UPI0010480131|nr:hypothetical protein [Kribbella sp. VKM Ac-2568]TCM35142.1 hypothetical protein EV648_12535 [Kribbella sp. VKM Ac-2568]
MTTALTLGAPIASDGAEAHADWLEILALLSADRDSSYQDLVAEFRRSGTLDAVTERLAPDRGSEKSQELADEAFSRLDVRSKSCGDGYPFKIADQTVSVRDPNFIDSPYVFMLLLRHFGVKAGPRTVKGAGNFEELAEVAARHYLGGTASGVRSFHFGFPRRTTPAGFEAALNELCEAVGEGGGSRSRPSRKDQKDAKLDLVAWRPFADGRNGKVIAFGQCAAGDNWDGKATELSPMQFTGLWLLTSRFAFTPVVFFFVPGCLSDEEWDSVSFLGNTVPFDRCRVSAMLADAGLPADLQGRTKRWSKYVLERISR